MCGIGGILHRGGAPVDKAALQRMAACLQHRGPDDNGLYAEGPVGLAHTRLSIIDLSAQGRQPMQSDDGRFVLVYNGEIYNYREIRKTLAAKGRRFRGHSDSEVVLQACIEWGADAFPRFEGMFAMALWDNRERRIRLARDRFGIKPLYYRLTRAGLVFGSEIKALLASGEVQARIDWAGVHEFLHYNTALGARTTFDGIAKLPPGHMLTLDAQGLQVEPYASAYGAQTAQDDFPTAARKVRGLLDRAVRSHLVSDVPVGVFLSGGIDSSAIVAFASRHYDGRLKTFSAGFDFDKGVNELPEAHKVAERFGTDHHELHVETGSCPPVIEQLVRTHDAPFGDAANIPLYLLSRQLGGGVKVILQGDGGDEVFGGYHSYTLVAWRRRLQALARATAWARPFIPRGGRWRRRFLTLQKLACPDPSLQAALLRSEAPVDYPPAQVFSPEVRALLEAADPFRRYKEYYRRFAHLDALQRMLYTDLGILLPDVYFEKVDKPTMAHGIEIRVPLVDTQLAAYATGLPSAYKCRGRRKKRILREALRGVLPDEVLDRPKTGFSVPMRHWLRTSLAEYMQSVLLDDSALNAGMFDRAALERCIREHLSGRRNNDKLLYKLINLVLWRRAYNPAD